jgi:hypothetical protein
VDWARPLRKLISREDHLGPIRLWLLRLIDPIEWYMRRSEEARPTPHDPGSGGAERWNAYLPVERDASAELLVIDIAPLDDPTGDDADEFMRMHDSVRQKHSAYFEEKARDLLAGRDVSCRRPTERPAPDSCASETARCSRTGTRLATVAGTVCRGSNGRSYPTPLGLS